MGGIDCCTELSQKDVYERFLKKCIRLTRIVHTPIIIYTLFMKGDYMEKERKTDRRTLYTIMVIKEAMLILLTQKDYSQITVADLCRTADINRGTFYLHFQNVTQVVDELLEDALSQTSDMLVQVGCKLAQGKECRNPFCHFIRENKKYQALFFSDSLRGRVIEKITIYSASRFAQAYPDNPNFPAELREALSIFQMNGCLAICKQYISCTDSQWAVIQGGIYRFLKNGFDNL